MLSVVGGPSEIDDIVCMSVGMMVAQAVAMLQQEEVQCSEVKCSAVMGSVDVVAMWRWG